MMQVENCAREIEQLWLYLPKNETELLGRLAESLKAELNGRIALLNEKERKRVDFESKLDAVKRKLVIVEEFLGKNGIDLTDKVNESCCFWTIVNFPS